MNHEQRARDLLEKMTLSEKIAQLHAVWLQIEGDGTWSFRKAKSTFVKAAVDDPREIMKDGVGQITRPLAGSIAAILIAPLFGIPALIFIALSRQEFE